MAEDLTQSFAIPKEAPGGEAVFAWSWFNRQGNREMYHVSSDCSYAAGLADSRTTKGTEYV